MSLYFQELSEILQNPKVMLPWNELFTNQELKRWIVDNIKQYKRYRTGYLAVIKKSDLSFIGIVGVIKCTSQVLADKKSRKLN